MIILHPTQTVMRWTGFNLLKTNSAAYDVVKYLMFFFSSAILLPMFGFVCANISDLPLVAECISICGAELCTMTKSWNFLVERDALRTLLDGLQAIVDRKQKIGRSKHYVDWNSRANYFSRLFYITVLVCLLFFCFGPLMFLLYQYKVGKLSNDMLRHPVNMLYPFDSFKTPGFQFVYMLCSLSMISMACFVSFSACLFLGQSALIIACLKDLSDMLMEIVDDANIGLYVVGVRQQAEVERRLVECVKFHNTILRLVTLLGDIWRTVISAQFLVAVWSLVMLAFEVQSAENMTIDKQIANVLFTTVLLVDLFIYCYCGNEVALQCEYIADAAYCSSWYKCSPKHRRYYGMILLRAQRPHVIKAFGMFDCSLETYASLLQMVGSSLALVQSIA